MAQMEFSNIANPTGYSQGYPGGHTPVGYSQPVVGQPAAGQAHNATIVINQVPPTVLPSRNWSSGIFDCTSDCSNCMFVTFCPPCAACELLGSVGEDQCTTWCCVYNWVTAVRVKVRMQLGIRGSICDDCCMSTFCGSCVVCQMMREVKLAREQDGFL